MHTILYIRGTSEKLKVCVPLGFKAVFKPQRTMRSLLVQVKKIPPENQRVVYEVPCKDCGLKYIGEN